MAYNGYLIKVGNYTIPLGLIRANTYKVQQTIVDLDSYRDANGILHRTALDHVPNKVEFETIPMLTNTQMSNLMTNIRNNYTVAKERKANVTCYIPETDSYVTQEMYMPDIQFTPYFADNKVVKYNQTRFAFIGY